MAFAFRSGYASATAKRLFSVSPNMFSVFALSAGVVAPMAIAPATAIVAATISATAAPTRTATTVATTATPTWSTAATATTTADITQRALTVSATGIDKEYDGTTAAQVTLSTDELQRIQYIWQRVAEDYAPFDVERISPGFLKDPVATNKKLKALYFSCGTEDPRMPFQTKTAEELKSKGIESRVVKR